MSSTTSPTVTLDCVCDATTARPVDGLGDLVSQPDERRVVATCPSCDTVRRMDDWERDPTSTEPSYTLRLGEEAEEPHDGPNPFDRLVSTRNGGRAAAPHVSRSRRSVTRTVPDNCGECRTALTEAARREGPDAPEAGWEHYECPTCGHRGSLNVVPSVGDQQG